MAPHPESVWDPEIDRVVGRFAGASNLTLLATTTAGERVVYKPVAGERPLWDFPEGTLAAREVLTYRVAQAMGLDLVPETVLADGPEGVGAIQRYLEPDPEFDSLELARRGSARLWPVAVLDVVTNNADRKLGHVFAHAGRLVAIDHGLTFHHEDKLRTVLWSFAGQTLPSAMVGAVRRLGLALDRGLETEVAEQLGPASARALRERADALIRSPVHPAPPEDRPPLPWPPY